MQTSHAVKAERAIANREDKGLGVSTVQRLKRTGAAIDIGEGRNEKGETITFQRVMDWPLHVLYRSGALGKPDEALERYEAGKRFAEHHYQSGIAGSLHGVDLNRPGGVSPSSGMPIPASETAYRHRQQFRAALAALGLDYIAKVTALVVLNEVNLMDAMKGHWNRDDRQYRKGQAETAIQSGLDRLRELWG